MKVNFMNLLNTLSFILKHPLNLNHKWAALRRYFYWQIGSRLLPGAVAVRFVNDSRLLVCPGMTGATGNIYTGLHEFEDMSFVLHFLKKNDVFVDIGANVGTYTVLAAAVVGAKTLSIEPIPTTFSHLVDNINLNNIHDIVETYNIGVGRKNEILKFTTALDTTNHVISDDIGGVQLICLLRA
jgi:hypothetical protein